MEPERRVAKKRVQWLRQSEDGLSEHGRAAAAAFIGLVSLAALDPIALQRFRAPSDDVQHPDKHHHGSHPTDDVGDVEADESVAPGRVVALQPRCICKRRPHAESDRPHSQRDSLRHTAEEGPSLAASAQAQTEAESRRGNDEVDGANHGDAGQIH